MRLVSKLFAFALFAVALTPVVACTAGDDSSADDNVSTPTDEGSSEDELKAFSVTDADNGKTITVTEGQNLLVKLSSNPTTGYGWEVVSTDRTFGYPSAEKFFPNGGGVGSGGIERFTWKTKSPLTMVGEHHVKLEYKRSWETNVAPAKKFEFTVKIVSGSCPTLSPPAPNFCPHGQIKPKQSASGCTTGYECVNDCRTNGCSNNSSSCQMCWGSFACIPNGALC